MRPQSGPTPPPTSAGATPRPRPTTPVGTTFRRERFIMWSRDEPHEPAEATDARGRRARAEDPRLGDCPRRTRPPRAVHDYLPRTPGGNTRANAGAWD